MMLCSLLAVAALATPPEVGMAAPEYVAKLTTVEPTAAAQFKLGEWARQHGMKDVADGHFRAAVYIDPAFAAAQKALGRTLKGGIWETREERKNRLERESGMQAQLQTWRGRLKERGISEAVRGRVINEAGAAAIEEYAAGDRGKSLEAVRAFRASDHGAATWGLIRQAVASPFAPVRAEAATALGERNPDQYLAPLVEFQRPQSIGKSVVLGVGEVWRWREGDVQVTALPTPRATRMMEDMGPSPQNLAIQNLAAQGLATPELEDRYANLDKLRANATAALETATGLKLGNDFAKWRQMLPRISDSAVEAQSSKPTKEVTTYYQPDRIDVGTLIVLPTAGGGMPDT